MFRSAKYVLKKRVFTVAGVRLIVVKLVKKLIGKMGIHVFINISSDVIILDWTFGKENNFKSKNNLFFIQVFGETKQLKLNQFI